MSLPSPHPRNPPRPDSRQKVIQQRPPEHGPIFNTFRFVLDAPKEILTEDAFGMWKHAQFLRYSDLRQDKTPTRTVSLGRSGTLGNDAKLEIHVGPLKEQRPDKWPAESFDGSRSVPYPYSEWYTPEGRQADPGCQEWIEDLKVEDEMRDAMGMPTRYVKHKAGKETVSIWHKAIPTEWLPRQPIHIAPLPRPLLPTGAAPTPFWKPSRVDPGPNQYNSDRVRYPTGPRSPHTHPPRRPRAQPRHDQRLSPRSPPRGLGSDRRPPPPGYASRRDIARTPDYPVPKRLKLERGPVCRGTSREEPLALGRKRDSPPPVVTTPPVPTTASTPPVPTGVPTPVPTPVQTPVLTPPIPTPPVSAAQPPSNPPKEADIPIPRPIHSTVRTLSTLSTHLKEPTPATPTPPLTASLSAASPNRPPTPPLYFPPEISTVPVPGPESEQDLVEAIPKPQFEPEPVLVPDPEPEPQPVASPVPVRTAHPKPSAPVQERLAYTKAQLSEWQTIASQFPDLKELVEWQIAKVSKQLEVLRGELGETVY
ncbi:hypothetical protein IAR50_006768 [Cryptococcus sp. DSM 104548]